MSKVQILSRSHTTGLPGERASVDTVAVVYFSALIPPRSVVLPLQSYRSATGDELASNPRLRVYPKDQAAQAAELQAIGEDLKKVQGSPPPTFEIP